jgi:hypothetical protein
MESTSGRVEKDHSNDHATSLTSLHEALSNLTVDQLKERLQLLDSRAKSQRKADLIDVIQESLTGDSATREWHFLSQLEQAAVAEASHAPDLMHHEASVQAKYGGFQAIRRRIINLPLGSWRSHSSDSFSLPKPNALRLPNPIRSRRDSPQIRPQTC